VDERRFDEVTRVLGTAHSRRDVLRLLVGAGVAAFLAACQGQAPPTASGAASPTPTPSPTLSPTPGPTPGPTRSPTASLSAEDECPIPSVCGARQYCNEENTCICLRSAEGPIRCGQLPSSCDVPLCETSADCAQFGEGWFCDTPNSGCCTDPPAELTRCLAPCGTGPAVSPTASPYATATLAPSISPTSVTCPSCGTCKECRLAETNESFTCGDCVDTCAAATLCAEANTDLAFGALAGRLIADGYIQIPATEPESVQIYGGLGLERSVYISFFTHAGDATRTAQLGYVSTASHEVGAIAELFNGGQPDRLLFVQDGGVVQEVDVPSPSSGMLTAVGVTDPGCESTCQNLISALIVVVPLGLAPAMAVCAATVVCVAVLVGVAAGLAGGIALGWSDFCRDQCTTLLQTPRAYCGCDRRCYHDASSCATWCRTSLACFGFELCGPDPVCNQILPQFTG